MEYYYVMRVYSDTNESLLWEVVSCAIVDEHAAFSWKRYLEERSPNDEFFVIKREIDC